jgi:hypothetical protein
MLRLYPNAYLQFEQDGLLVYGRSFPYSEFESEQEAIAAAELYGHQHLQNLEWKKGAPLTFREQLSGKLPPAEPKQPEAPTSDAQPEANPFSARLKELASVRATTQVERTKIARRVAALKAAEAKWEAEQQANVEGGKDARPSK